jgi:hypothetical protein
MLRPDFQLCVSRMRPTSTTREPALAALLGALFVSVGCAPTSSSTVLREPVMQKCQKAALEACKEMTDGVVLYLDGQTVQGSRRLLAAGSQNSADGRERYATLLEQAQGLPGASKYKKELAQVVLVLAHAPPSQEDDGKAPEHIITAETDLYQARDGTVPAPATSPEWCSSNFGASATCVMVTRGPLFVTDVVSVGHQCRGQFASVLRGGSVRAHIEGPFDLHGGRLLLTSADTLVFGQKSAPPAPPAPPPVEPPPVKGKAAAPAPAQPVPATPPATADAAKDNCPFYWSGYVPYREVE